MKTRALAFCLLGLLLNSSIAAAGWTSVSTAQPNWLVSGSGSALFAADTSSIYTSSDSGKTWKSVTNPGAGPYSALSYINSQVWVGTEQQGAVYSSNQGTSWTTSNIGLVNPFTRTAPKINAITAQTVTSSKVVLGSDVKGAFYSSDSGASWKISQGIPVNPASCLLGTCSAQYSVNSLATLPGGDILATTDAGIYRSSDAGLLTLNSSGIAGAWSASGLSGSKVTALSVAAAVTYAIVDGGGLYRSTDGGSNWNKVASLAINPVAVLAHPAKAGVIFVGGAQGQVLRSADGGATWETISDNTIGSARISALAIPPDQADALVAATSLGVFRYEAALPPKFSFSIPPLTGVPLNTTIVSPLVTIIGLTKAEPISIVGGKYSLNGEPFTDQPGLVANGARLRVQLQSSTAPNTSATATVTINSVSAAFVITTYKITPITNLTQVFTSPPPGAQIKTDGSILISSTTPVALQPSLPAGIVIETTTGTPLTHSAGTLTFTPQTSGAMLTSTQVTTTTTALQVTSGTFDVQSTASNTIPVGNSSLTTSGTCPTSMSVQNTGSQTSTFVQNCVVYFNPSGTISSANGFSATTGTAVYGGETAEVSNSGSLDRIRIGSLTGDKGLPGDPLTLVNVTADSTIPNLDGSLQRLSNNATLLTVIQAALDSKFGVTASQISYDKTGGVVTYTANSKVYRFIPIDVPTVQINGAVAAANRFAATNPASSASGAFSLASQGISVTLASTLGYFTDLNKAMTGYDPASKIRIRSSGTLQLTLYGVDYVCAPGSNAAGGAQLPSTAPDFLLENGMFSFRDSYGATQVLYPAFADISVADQTVKALDASGSVIDNGDGTTTMNVLGAVYKLKPQYLLVPLPSAHVNEQWWLDGALIYLRYPDNTAQSITF